MVNYILIGVLISYYFIAFAVKMHYYKHSTGSSKGFFKYFLAQTITISILILLILFFWDMFKNIMTILTTWNL